MPDERWAQLDSGDLRRDLSVPTLLHLNSGAGSWMEPRGRIDSCHGRHPRSGRESGEGRDAAPRADTG